MKRLFIPVLFLALLGSRAEALTITLDAEQLRDQIDSLFPVKGLIVLTAATSNTFYGPTAASFAGGDELVLGKWDLDVPGFGMPGVLQVSTGDLTFTAGWNEGDQIKLYWYPTLTLASTAPGPGTRYGAYTDTIGIDGSAPWLTPSVGSTIGLKFATTDASFLFAGGSNAPINATALFSVIPEPSPDCLTLITLAGAGLVRWRQRR